MDGFSYYNLFDTKGIEYIIIIAFLLLIIPFWIMINRPLSIKAAVRAFGSSLLRIPGGLFLSGAHTWAHLDRSGVAKVGIDGLVTQLTGDVSVRMLVEPGQNVHKGEEITLLGHTGKKIKVESPVTGEIVAVNNELFRSSSPLGDDPYGRGWLVSIRPESWVSETAGYRLADDASGWLQSEMTRFRDFIALSLNRHAMQPQPLFLQDGGEMIDNPLSAMPQEIWDDFESEFMKLK